MKTIHMSLLLLLTGIASLEAEEPVRSMIQPNENGLTVFIINDNYKGDADLETAWGFAALVDYRGERLLYDTGNDEDLYKKNLQLSGIDPEEIPALFISHEHWDHTAGIAWVTATSPGMKCFLPASYAEQLEQAGTLPGNSTAVFQPAHLYGPYFSTGDDFAAFREQGLVVRTPDGGVLITGCGHPGVVEMVTAAREQLDIPVHMVIGGLHLLQHSEAQVETIAADLKELGIRKICPTHCTGDNAIAVLRKAFGDGYIPGGAGTRIVLEL